MRFQRFGHFTHEEEEMTVVAGAPGNFKNNWMDVCYFTLFYLSEFLVIFCNNPSILPVCVVK